jgi:hypothetical protein
VITATVRKVAAELHRAIPKFEDDGATPADILTAIAWLAVSACKSWEVDADDFVANFRKMMEQSGRLLDSPVLPAVQS